MTPTDSPETQRTPAAADELEAALPIAVNTFVWHSPLNDQLLAGTIESIADWGYDGIEIALENIGDWDPASAEELLTSRGLRSVVGAVFGPGRELTCASDSVIEDTQNYLRAAVE